MNTVPFTKKDIREYLDIKIQSWRKMEEMHGSEGRGVSATVASARIDVYQSIRKDLFGKELE